jgi:hypothetical protein
LRGVLYPKHKQRKKKSAPGNIKNLDLIRLENVQNNLEFNTGERKQANYEYTLI